MLKLGIITPKEFSVIVWIAQNDAETILGSYVIRKKLDVLKHKLNVFWEGALLLRRLNKCVACLRPHEWEEEEGMQQNISKLTFVVQMQWLYWPPLIRFMIYFLLCFVFFENFTILFIPPPAQEFLARCILQDFNNKKWCAACSHKASGASYCLLYVLSSVCVWVGSRRTASGTLLPLTQGSPLVMCDCRMLWRTAEAWKKGASIPPWRTLGNKATEQRKGTHQALYKLSLSVWQVCVCGSCQNLLSGMPNRPCCFQRQHMEEFEHFLHTCALVTSE